jgi:anti-sigma factor RsiW
MSCNDMLAFLAAYVDDELGVADAIRVEQHLSECVPCRNARDELLALRSHFHEISYRSSPQLRERVRSRVREAAREETGRRYRLKGPIPYWVAAAAAVLIIGTVLTTTRTNRSPIVDDVVDGHVRSLQAGHLVDVLSSDRHTVKPWFQGRLDFAPVVPDLIDRGWILQGGRLDYVQRRAVAALVYQRRKHEINVFIWPNHDRVDDTIRREDAQGYHLLHWNGPVMTYWLVSDLDPTELLEFARALHGN